MHEDDAGEPPTEATSRKIIVKIGGVGDTPKPVGATNTPHSQLETK